MTCNPNWPEILHELRPREEANDRPDLTSRVFNMKLNALLKDLLQNGVLGTAVADIHVVEWQKRGLPHDHILIILRNQDKCVTATIMTGSCVPSFQINPPTLRFTTL
jgi:hypothetical protein